MNDDQNNDNARQQHTLGSRGSVSRPPIEWPVRNDTSEHSERAAAYAREHVERAHASYQQQALHAQMQNQQQAANPQPQQPQQPQQQSYDWNTYHTAWQQYYHQYFYRYYAGWWQQQKAEEAARQPEAAMPSGEPLSDHQKIAKELRSKVRSTVEKRSKKIKASSHFKPVVAALSVGTAFLLINYNQVLVGAAKQYISPGNNATTPVIVEANAENIVSGDPKIIIPKIGVEAPVVYDEPRVDEPSYQAALERGVVRLGNTADPGTKGNVVIGGHSSNNVFNAGGFKYVFVNLKRLDVGDIFYLNYGGKRYTYKVTVAKKIITPKETSILAQTETPTVTLFTCDPPGTNVNRLIVQGEQISPDPGVATESTNRQTAVNEDNPLPSVAPSLWDRIFR